MDNILVYQSGHKTKSMGHDEDQMNAKIAKQKIPT